MEKNYWSNKETHIFKFQQLLWKINNIFNKKKEKLFRWFIFTKKKRVYLQKKNICYVKLTKEKWRKGFVFMKKRIYKRKVFYFFKELQKNERKRKWFLPSPKTLWIEVSVLNLKDFWRSTSVRVCNLSPKIGLTWPGLGFFGFFGSRT